MGWMVEEVAASALLLVDGLLLAAAAAVVGVVVDADDARYPLLPMAAEAAAVEEALQKSLAAAGALPWMD